jgi:epoxyqueuosine reductase
MTGPEARTLAAELGFDPVGIAPANPPVSTPFYEAWLAAEHHAEMGYLARHLTIKQSLENLLPGVQSVLAVGLNYRRQDPWQPGRPRIASYARGRDYHKVLSHKLKQIASKIETNTRICVDAQPLLEREIAQRAGLGWFGKNTMLINSARGSFFVLGFLLTTEIWEPDSPAQGGCGTCRKCIDACPTGAIIPFENRWAVNSTECISYLTIEHRGEFENPAKVGEWTFGCDVCQDVCPFNEPRPSQPLRAPLTNEPDFRRENPFLSRPLQELAQINEAEWDIATRGSAVRRAGYEGFVRNIRANLTNLKDN